MVPVKSSLPAAWPAAPRGAPRRACLQDNVDTISPRISRVRHTHSLRQPSRRAAHASHAVQQPELTGWVGKAEAHGAHAVQEQPGVGAYSGKWDAFLLNNSNSVAGSCGSCAGTLRVCADSDD